jgi:DNA recombination protein RmuC
MIIGVVIGLAVGLAIGIAWALVRNARVSSEARVVSGRLGDAQLRLTEAQAFAAEQDRRLAGATTAAHDAETARAVLENELRVLRHHEGEAEARAEAAQRLLEGTFSRLSDEALARTSKQFLALADTRLGQARTAAAGDLTQRQDAIEQLLQPFRETLARYERGVQDMERQRQNAYSTLNERVAALREGHERLQQETHNLVTALRSPQTRGRWGEMTLRRAVEAAGMLAHVDFEEQHTTTSEGGLLRPDMVVHLPGGGEVVIDSKVPLDAFLHFTEAQNEEDRKSFLTKHGRQLRTHIEQLAKKEYWKQYDGSPEFVIAFIPGEPLLAAACEADATLQDFALNKRVVLATPNTLVAALRTIALSWRQDTLAANAREVKELGAELYERLRIWTGHMQSLQKSLASSVEAYNKAVGSLESRVLVTARKLPGLGVLDGASAQIEELAPIESSPRHLQAVELIDDEDETGESTLWSLPEGGASTGTGA